jgi:uncharacterized tellurite resistance protein B-like protein
VTELGMALAVLMLEVAKSDFQESDSEIQSMTAWLKSQDLGLSHDNVTRLLDSARGEQARSTGLFEYTRRACEQMSDGRASSAGGATLAYRLCRRS